MELADVELSNVPLERGKDSKGNAIKKGLYDPENPIVQLLLWLYTIEPPIYAHLNKACRLM